VMMLIPLEKSPWETEVLFFDEEVTRGQ